MIVIPENHHCEVFGRSDLTLNYGINVHSGFIDSDYHGIVCFILFNNLKVDYHVLPGQRIGQLIITRNISAKFIEVGDLNRKRRKWFCFDWFIKKLF